MPADTLAELLDAEATSAAARHGFEPASHEAELFSRRYLVAALRAALGHVPQGYRTSLGRRLAISIPITPP